MSHSQSSENKVSLLLWEFVAVVFMGVIALAAHLSGMAVVLFPELAALAQDVLKRPAGQWARQPIQLVVAPTLTAAFGLFCTRHLHYTVWNILLIVVVSLAIIRLLRCSMSPAISAGVLPLVLHEQSWFYPAAIFFDLSLLLAVLLVRKRLLPAAPAEPASESLESHIIDALEAVPRSRLWWVAFFSFITILGAAAQWTGLRFLLFPPLIVMSYELFGHPDVPGWMKRPILLPIVCLTTATLGLLAVDGLHPTFLAASLTMLCSVILLRFFKLHMPPALAIGIIPFILEKPDARYALSVFLGTSALTVAYLEYKRLSDQRA